MMTRVDRTGFVSIVSYVYDFWDVIGWFIPSLLSTIMARDGKVVIRPDSGDPVKIVCGDPNGATLLERKGAVEALWDIFGGTTTEKGYKLLDSHIGLIYGDAITISRANEIVTKLKQKGFASINVVFGIGSYTYQYNTRDTFGWALKSTLAVINGDEKQIFKDPKTDNGIKKSQKGAVAVVRENGVLTLKDGLYLNDVVSGNELVEIFRDGKLLVDEKFSDIRKRLV
jgi:nicotinamide phosphoribosyltransferase